MLKKIRIWCQIQGSLFEERLLPIWSHTPIRIICSSYFILTLCNVCVMHVHFSLRNYITSFTEFYTSKNHYSLYCQNFMFRKANMNVYNVTPRFAFLTNLSAEYKGRTKISLKRQIRLKVALDCPDSHQAYLLNVIKLQSQAGHSFLLKWIFHY